jgi:hypothetical protein
MSYRKAITIQVYKINLRRYLTFLLICDFTTGIYSEQSTISFILSKLIVIFY